MKTQQGQVTVCERSGALPLDANDSSPGLQALVRLYCSSPQQLGYVVAAPVAHTPAAADYCSTCGLELVARVNCHWAATTNDVARWQSCHSLTRLVPEPDKGYFSLSAADVVLGNLGGEEVRMYERLAELKDKLELSALPRLSGVGRTSSRAWLVTPYYGRAVGALKNGSQILQATEQVVCVIASLAAVDLLHGDVSAHNIAVRGHQAVLIDLAKLRSLQDEATPANRITGTPSFMALSVLKGKRQTVSSELESLFYSMLYAATSGALH